MVSKCLPASVLFIDLWALNGQQGQLLLCYLICLEVHPEFIPVSKDYLRNLINRWTHGPNPKKGKYSMPSTWCAKEIKTTTSPLLRVWHLLTSWIPKHTFIMFWNNISLLIVSNDVRRSLTIEVSPSLYDSLVEISPSIFWYWSFVLDMISRQPHRLLPMHLLNNTHKIHKIKYLTFYHMHSPCKMLS